MSVYKNDSKKNYDIDDKKRKKYRKSSILSAAIKKKSINGQFKFSQKINVPNLNPIKLIPRLKKSNLNCLSLFSGCGGLDLGFDLAGFNHLAAFELIPVCGDTLKKNRPNWKVYSGEKEGDVTKINWKNFNKLKVDLIHGGPPCQPFSIAGGQEGEADERNMWGEFTKAVNFFKPKAFVAENVLGLNQKKFESFLEKFIYKPLKNYHIIKFTLNSADFGVPQIRKRVFFVGFIKEAHLKNFNIPKPTHSWTHLSTNNKNNLNLLNEYKLPKTMGLREALGLNNIGTDSLCPTIRSAFTGKRNTTSILNSSASQKTFQKLKIWPNGVQLNREKAAQFPAAKNAFRLSIQDIALVQGFPKSWKICGAAYQVLGQLGNSVCPPVAYNVAKEVLRVLKK